MRKILVGVLVGTMVLTSINAGEKSKRTYLNPRPVGVNLPMELTTWHDHIMNRGFNTKASHIQVTPFFQASVKGEKVGRYFGIGNNQNSFKIAPYSDANFNAGYLINNFYIHKYNSQTSAASEESTIFFNPKQEAYGVRLDYFQNIYKKIYLKASMPLIHLENDLHVKYTGEIPDANGNYLSEFFNGNDIVQPLNNNKQSALTHAKFNTARKARTGVADIDLALGYRFLESNKHHLYVDAGITIPTAHRVRGEYLFEPIPGNGHHFGFKAGADFWQKLWDAKHHFAKLILAANYSYLFEGTEKRTIPIKDLSYPYLHYALGFENGKNAETNYLFPMANILTRDVTVRPGNQFDFMAAFSFNTTRFIIDLGYNLYARQTESVKLKNAWTDNTYGVANTDLNLYASDHWKTYDISTDAFKIINNSDLDINGAKTPTYLTHKAFGSIGYAFNMAHNPASVSFGASYEFASSNYQLEGYALWLKGDISF